jgi:uncharacterized membrane protein
LPAPGQRFNIGDAFSWAWNKFTENAVPLILSFLAYGVVGAAAQYLVFALLGDTSTNDNDGGFGGSFSANLGTVGTIVLAIVVFVYIAFVQAATLYGTLGIADGRTVTIGSFFKPRNFGGVILAALLVGVLTAVGYLLCVIPGLIFSFFTLFTIAFASDHDLSAIEALKASFTTVRANIGSVLVSWLVQGLVVTAGMLACGIGVIVAAPVALLIQTYTYRRLSGGATAPLTQ